MNIFGLFQNSESPDWVRFKAFSPAVQQDVASLLTLHSLARYSIPKELQKADGDTQISHDSDSARHASRMFSESLKTHKELAGELQLCLLATCVGKVFGAIKWNLLPPERAIECLGLLAMCEYRNLDQLEGDVDLKQSGYSSDPDEARTQYIVLAANTAGVTTFSAINNYLDEVFLGRWNLLRNDLLVTNPSQIGINSSTLSEYTKGLLLGLSPARRDLLLGIGESLAKKEAAKTPAKPANIDPVKAAAPFDAAKYRSEHPLLFVPFPKLISIMEQAASDIRAAYIKLQIDEYELHRLVSAKERLPNAMIGRLLTADTRVLAYAILVAVAGDKDEKFIGCGVWKKVTESSENKGRGDFQLMAEMQANGILGGAKSSIEPTRERDFTLSVNHAQLCRRAPSNYLKIPLSHRHEHLNLLYAGTTILRHVLNHPEHGKALASMTIALYRGIDHLVVELTKGELLNWDQQKDLPLEGS